MLCGELRRTGYRALATTVVGGSDTEGCETMVRACAGNDYTDLAVVLLQATHGGGGGLTFLPGLSWWRVGLGGCRPWCRLHAHRWWL